MKRNGYFKKSISTILIASLISSTIPTTAHSAAADEYYGPLTAEQRQILVEVINNLKAAGEGYRDYQVQLFRDTLNLIKDKRAMNQARSDADLEALKYGFRWKVNEVPKPGTPEWRTATGNGQDEEYLFTKQYCDPSALGNAKRVFALHKHALSTALSTVWSTLYTSFTWDVKEFLNNIKNRYENYTFSDFANRVYNSPATEIALVECYEGLPDYEAKIRRLNFIVSIMSYDVMGTVMGLGLSGAASVLLWKVALPKITMAAKVRLLQTPTVKLMMPYMTKKNAIIAGVTGGIGYLIYSYYYYNYESEGIESIETDPDKLLEESIISGQENRKTLAELNERINFINSSLRHFSDLSDEDKAPLLAKLRLLEHERNQLR